MACTPKKTAPYIFLVDGKSIEIVLSPTLLDHWVSSTISDLLSSSHLSGPFTLALIQRNFIFVMLLFIPSPILLYDARFLKLGDVRSSISQF